MNETEVKRRIIDPLLDSLGLDKEKEIECEITLGSGKRLDYLLKKGDKNICVLEVKASSVNIKNEKHLKQVHQYAADYHINCRFIALSNGEDFILYETHDHQKPLVEVKLNERGAKTKIKNVLLEGKIEKVEKKKQLSDDWYLEKTLPDIIEKPKKQATRRHFGVHGYFTKQSWDIVSKYIKHFSQAGDTVLDPFGGSGVTLIEALMTGRNGIHIDLNPLSIFWMEALLSNIDPHLLQQEGLSIIEKYKKGIKKISLEDVKGVLPENVALLSKGADVKKLHQIFSKKQLKELGYLKQLILKVRDKTLRKNLLLAFSSTLTKNNLTYHTSKFMESNPYGGNSGIFMYYRYRLSKNPVKINLLKSFDKKLEYLIKAKKELQFISAEVLKNAKFYKGDATNLKIRLNNIIKTQVIKDESIDYIYTDPPYGKKIEYLDLSTMWNAWLDLKVSEDDYRREAIEGGHLQKPREAYGDMIVKSLKEMFRVLKWNRWMSFVFQHQDPYYWYLIVENSEKIGFEYCGVVKQNNGQTSFKQRQNPFSVLSGQLIINFIKKKNPQALMKADLGQDVTAFILNNVEAVIAEKNGATINDINDSLVINALELGFLDKLSEYGDLVPYLQENFAYDNESKKYRLPEKTTFKSHIPIEKRIKYFLISFLTGENRQNRFPDFSEIVYNIMPLLKNGQTPEEQTIKKVLEEIAVYDPNVDGFLLKEKGQLRLL